MLHARVHRLFRGIVVAGAAMGCTPEPEPAPPQPAPPQPPPATDPSQCERPEQFYCAELESPVECVCNVDAPYEAADCDPLYRFECQSYDPPLGCMCIWTIVTR